MDDDNFRTKVARVSLCAAAATGGAPPICWPGVSVLMNAVHQLNFDRMRVYTARLANGCCLAGGELPPETMYN